MPAYRRGVKGFNYRDKGKTGANKRSRSQPVGRRVATPPRKRSGPSSTARGGGRK